MDLRGEQRNVGKLSGTTGPTPSRPSSGVPVRVHGDEPSTTTTPSGTTPSGGWGGPETNVLREDASKLFWDAKNLAWDRLRNIWNNISRPDTWDKICTTYVQSSLKVEEAKHLICDLAYMPLNAQHALFCAGCKNLIEKQELLKRHLDEYKGKDLTKKNFFVKEKEWLESIQRFVELVLHMGLALQDAFEESIRDYSFAVQKAQRYRERYEDFKRFKGKIDPVTYKKNRKALKCCKCDADHKVACAKVCTEEIYHKNLHFYTDVHEIANETMDFLKNRFPDIENFSKRNLSDNPPLQTLITNLYKRTTEIRDLLEEAIRISRDKVPYFSNKKEIESLVQQRKKFYEGAPTTSGQTSTRTGIGAEK
jgi:hypothetical protein